MKCHKPHLKKNREYESLIGATRVARGFSIKDVCADAKVDPTTFCALQNGMESPLYVYTGYLKPTAKRICDVLDIDVEDAFPRYFCKIKTPENEINDLTQGQINEILNQKTETPEMFLQLKQQSHIVSKLLSVLNPREEFVLKHRNGFDGSAMSLNDIGVLLKISQERVRQIERKALRRLRRFIDIIEKKGEFVVLKSEAQNGANNNRI